MTPKIEVQVGQVWLDNDRRKFRDGKPRELTVMEVASNRMAIGASAVCRSSANRTVSILLFRFKPTKYGFRLKEGQL